MAALAVVPHYLPAAPALAWCGGYFPGKISNDINEEFVPFSAVAADGAEYRTNIFVRIVRPPRRAVFGSSARKFASLPPLPAVLVVGFPGVSYDYCENLEGLAVSGRRVILVNTCEAPLRAETKEWMPPPQQPTWGSGWTGVHAPGAFGAGMAPLWGGQMTPQPAMQAVAPGEVRICFPFLNRGFCQRGAMCKFRHLTQDHPDAIADRMRTGHTHRIPQAGGGPAPSVPPVPGVPPMPGAPPMAGMQAPPAPNGTGW